MTDQTHNTSTQNQPRRPIRGSVLAQVAVSAYLHLHKSDWATWLRPIFRGILKALGKTDRLVKITVGGAELVVPVTHPLPLERAINPSFLQQFGRIATAITYQYPSMTAIVLNASYGAELAVIRSQSSIPLLGCTSDPTQYRILNRNMLHVENVDTCFIEADTQFDTEWIQVNAVRYENAKWIIWKYTTSGQMDITPWIQKKLIVTIEWQPSDRFELSLIYPAIIENGYTTCVMFDQSGRYLATLYLTEQESIVDAITYLSHTRQGGGCMVLFHANHTDCMRTLITEERLLARRPS